MKLFHFPKILLSTAVAFVGLTASLTSAATTRFEVQVQPDTFKTSEFVDVTITAIDANGSPDTTFEGDVWISVQGFDATDPDVVVPGSGIGFFEASDQGTKIFSKGLSVKKPGTYVVEVADLFDESINGIATIQVSDEQSGPPAGTLTLTAPAQGTILTQESFDVIGESTYTNTPLSVLIDGQEVTTGLSDQQGAFIIPVSDITPGQHTLQIQATDIDGEVLASSSEVVFELESDTATLYEGLSVTPAGDVTVGDTLTLTLTTADRVDAALITLGEGTAQPMTQQSVGVFTKQIRMDMVGDFMVDVTLMQGAESTFFEDVQTVMVQDELRSIGEVIYTSEDSRNRVTLTWEDEGTIQFYKIRYGTNRTNLRLSLTTNKKEGIIVLADPTIAYYAQVFPVDTNGEVSGVPSEILEIGPLQEPQPVCGNRTVEDGEQCDDGNTTDQDGCSSTCQIEAPRIICGDRKAQAGEQCDDGNLIDGDGCSSTCQIETPTPEPEQHQSAPVLSSCTTTNIPLRTMQVNDEYFLSWSPVDNAVSYIVYRADSSVNSLSQMNVVSRTTSTRFQYPFDPLSEIDQYAWYAVEAICENNDQRQIGNIQAVKVGPEHTILFLLGLLVTGVMTARVVRN